VSDSSSGIETLLERRLPSAIARDDEALAKSGVPDGEIAAARNAFAALGLAETRAEAPPARLKERLLASKQRGGKYGIFADRIARLFDLPIAEAEALMKKIEDPAAWTPFLVEGLEMIPVTGGPACKDAIATLVRIQPGTRFPDHAHVGSETMLVLDGGFHEPVDGGEEVWRGDEIHRENGTAHALVGLPGVPCVAAAVIFGHADFK
jgi:quercetin dioxygenase-like cupin family protein